jgi:hypothetical protein
MAGTTLTVLKNHHEVVLGLAAGIKVAGRKAHDLTYISCHSGICGRELASCSGEMTPRATAQICG